jgi:hypothetical protein
MVCRWHPPSVAGLAGVTGLAALLLLFFPQKKKKESDGPEIEDAMTEETATIIDELTDDAGDLPTSSAEIDGIDELSSDDIDEAG